MTGSIAAYLDNLERAVLESHVILAYIVQQHEITPMRADLVDGGLLEVFEHVTVNPDGTLLLNKYRYHWQDAAGNLVRQWDTAAHHLQLPHAPHHVHLADGGLEGIAKPPDIAAIVAQIEAQMCIGGHL